MKKYFIYFILPIVCTQNLHAQIFINEFLASNSNNIIDPDFNSYSDWIELYNSKNSPVDISGWYLNDQSNATLNWKIPNGTIIPAKGYLILWADGMDQKLHTNFKLSATGEEIILLDPSGNQMDLIQFSTQQTDISYGRKTDGDAVLGFFTIPTPGSSNNKGTFYTNYVEQVPVFSISGGFFTSNVIVNIQDLYNKGIVRYTIDGSEPNEKSPQFGQALTLSKTTVVKARMFYLNQIPGPVVTNTYFINEHFDQRKLPIISLSTLPEYFYNKDSGLYVQNFKPPWEYPVHLEFYQPDGLLGFHHDAGMAVGGENAWILPQKLLNIYSRKIYGAGHFDFQLFPNNSRKTNSDFALRCSGNDWSNTFFRDGMMQGLIKDYADLDGQDFRPCAVYFNGAYLGMQNIREKQDADYCEYYHNIDPDSLDYIENNTTIDEGNDLAYKEMLNQLNSGIKSDAAFNEFDQIADTKNYTDYIISQIFSANTSWGHNISCFRKRSQNGRWRWLLHDYDRGFNLSNVSSIDMSWATATNGQPSENPAWATLFLRRMLENENFKQRFIDRFAEHLYVTYHPQTINKKVNDHKQLIVNEMPYQIDRWKGTMSSYGDAIPSFAYWESEVEKLKQFGVQRNAHMWNNLNSFFNLNGLTSLSLDVSDNNHGTIRLHEIKIPNYPWTGTYFQHRNVTLTAEAKPGFQFSHWTKMTYVQTILIPTKSKWKYRDAAVAPPSNWFSATYNDLSWSSGNGEFGYGDGDETTTLNYGTDQNNKTPSYYFRTEFNIADLTKTASVILRLKVDDGAVVFLNGKEIWRINMAPFPVTISFDSLALSAISGTAENGWNEINILSNALVNGKNKIAVEVHQNTRNSSDISFDGEVLMNAIGASSIVSMNNIYTTILDSTPTSLQAVFESNGSCGILPDSVLTPLTLTSQCSPYFAPGNVYVKPNVTLTIEKGVELLFPAHANLFIDGDLQINGTESNPVVIKGTDNQQIWGGIFLRNTTALSNLHYTKIENASAGIDRTYFPAAISAYHANLKMDHLDLTKVTDNPIFARYSNVELTHSILKSNVTGDCINIKQGYGVVEQCEFVGGREADMDGIDFDGVKGGIIRNNIIHDFRGDNCDGLDIGEQCEKLIIENNFIYHCFDKGISVGQQSSAHIIDNTIAYTAIGIALKDESLIIINHCTLFGNQVGISAYEKNAGYLGGHGNIENCIISNESSDAYLSDSYSTLNLKSCLSDLDSSGTSQGTIIANPIFEQPTLYNFNLKSNSPAKNRATDGKDLGALSLPKYLQEPQLMISEIFYDDSLSALAEFIEIYNPGNKEINLSNYTISLAIDFSFPSGAKIAPHEAVIVTLDKSKFIGQNYQVFEWTNGKLRNEGEAINLFDADGILVDFVNYNNKSPWPKSSNLQGKSIEIVSDQLDNHFGPSWKESNHLDGTPGIVDFSTSTIDNSKQDFQVIPNPARHGFYVLFNNNHQEGVLNLYNEFGQTVFSMKTLGNEHHIYIDAEQLKLKSGIYLINYQSGSGQKSSQLLNLIP